MSRKKIEIDLSDKNIASVIEKSILDENIRLKKENEKLRIEVYSWKNKAQAVDYDLKKRWRSIGNYLSISRQFQIS